jgi:hypothetical protein
VGCSDCRDLSPAVDDTLGNSNYDGHEARAKCDNNKRACLESAQFRFTNIPKTKHNLDDLLSTGKDTSPSFTHRIFVFVPFRSHVSPGHLNMKRAPWQSQ